MTKTLSRLGALALAALVAGPLAAQQTTDNRVGANTDWSVFQETDPAECFAVSAPKSQENTRDGQRVEVSRGETLLFVFFRPSENVNGQVTFTGGYPFAANSTVTLDVAGTQFTFHRGEWACPPRGGRPHRRGARAARRRCSTASRPRHRRPATPSRSWASLLVERRQDRCAS
jgi:hypothetical protein